MGSSQPSVPCPKFARRSLNHDPPRPPHESRLVSPSNHRNLQLQISVIHAQDDAAVELPREIGYHQWMKPRKNNHSNRRRIPLFPRAGDKFWVTRVLVDLQNHYRTMKSAKTA